MQQPAMLWIISLQKMVPLQSDEKCMPLMYKLPSNLNPKTFNWVLITNGPHMKFAHLRPGSNMIRIEISWFSPPLSPRTLEGMPKLTVTFPLRP
jgi:hypothetical protein